MIENSDSTVAEGGGSGVSAGGGSGVSVGGSGVSVGGGSGVSVGGSGVCVGGGSVWVGRGVDVSVGDGVLLGTGVLVGMSVGVLVGMNVLVGISVGVFDGTNVFVGTGVKDAGTRVSRGLWVGLLTKPWGCSMKASISSTAVPAFSKVILTYRASTGSNLAAIVSGPEMIPSKPAFPSHRPACIPGNHCCCSRLCKHYQRWRRQ